MLWRKKMKQVNQIYGFIERNLNLFKRFFAWELVWMIYHLTWALSTAFMANAMGVISGAEMDTARIMVYLLIGSVAWTYLSSIFLEMGWQVTVERWEGTIEYTFMAPVKRSLHMLGSSAFAVLYGLIRSVFVVVVVLAVFSIDLPKADYMTAFVLTLIASVSFIGMGMMAAVIPLISPEKGTQAVHIIEAVMMLFSGIFYPLEILPGWMQAVARWSPATYVLDGVRRALLDGIGLEDQWHNIWPLIVSAIVCIPMGLLVFRLCEDHAKRVGSLKRTG